MNHGNGKAGILDAAASVIETSVHKVFPDLDRRKRPLEERQGPAAAAAGTDDAHGTGQTSRRHPAHLRRRRSDRDGPG